MRIIHTADLHLGQIVYQNYDRTDEHKHYFDQLKNWCMTYQPDALIVSGDIFDIQQPSAQAKKDFTDFFTKLHKSFSKMRIVITAGNHDSATRIQADSAVWDCAGTTLVGTPPPTEGTDWEDKYIVRLDNGYIIAMPHTVGERKEQLQHLLDFVAAENTDDKPVIMIGHAAVGAADCGGHEVGTLKFLGADAFGTGYDYLALGHIHKPQTVGHMEDAMKEGAVTYPAPVIRYSGSALHVSCDEIFPHSVSLVDIDHHGGDVTITPLRINELRHFYILPLDGSAYDNADDAINGIKELCKTKKRGYFRLRINYATDLPYDFNQMVNDTILPTNEEIRYNPKTIWEGHEETKDDTSSKPTFEVAELQQMTDPGIFIEKTIDQYPELDLEDMRKALETIAERVKSNEEAASSRKSAKAKAKAEQNTTEAEE